MASTRSRLPRRLLAAAVAAVLGVSLALVGSAPSYAAYDTIVVKDKKGDLGYGGRYKFPDVVQVSYQHVGTRKQATLRAVVQLRRDVRWNRLDQLSFDANKYQIHVFANDSGVYRVRIWQPDGQHEKACKACRITLAKTKHRLVVTAPYSQLGKPSNIKLGILYIEQGMVQDRVARPPRVLY